MGTGKGREEQRHSCPPLTQKVDGRKKRHISSNSNKFSVIKNKSINNEEWGAAEWPGQPAHHLSEHAVHRGYPKLSQG